MVKTGATGKATALAAGEGGLCGIFSGGIAIRPRSGDLFLDPGSERPVIQSGGTRGAHRPRHIVK
jgi:hypothetical protein